MRLPDTVLKYFGCDYGWNSSFGSRSRFGVWPDKSEPDAEGIYSMLEAKELADAWGMQAVGFAEHVSDPAKPWRITNADAIGRSLVTQAEFAHAMNQDDDGFPVFMGVDAAILLGWDSRLEVPDELLEKYCDCVVAARKNIGREKDPDAIRESLLVAARHRLTRVVAHPDRYIADMEESLREMWREVLEAMQTHGKAFEFNLRYPPSRSLLEMAVSMDVPIAISVDWKDANQYWTEHETRRRTYAAKKRWANNQPQPGDDELLVAHKDEVLTSPAPFAGKLEACVATLQSLGVIPEQVINSSPERLVRFLLEGRAPTQNLRLIATRMGIGV